MQWGVNVDVDTLFTELSTDAVNNPINHTAHPSFPKYLQVRRNFGIAI